MNNAHLHLLFNHFPIVVPMLGLMVMIIGFIFRSEIVKRIAFFLFIFGAISAFASFSTGEGAEEVLDEVPGIDDRFMEIHEETAELFSILSYLLGGISVIGLWASWKRKSFAKYIAFATVGVSLVVIFFATQTGNTGGEIRHTEIRGGNSGAPSLNTPAEEGDDD